MHEETSRFSGTVGRVLWGSVSPITLLSGILVGMVLLVGDYILFAAQAPTFATPFNQIVLAFALARYALNGQYGEWRGSIFSGVGGSWVEVMLIAARFLALTFVWLLPLILLGLSPDIEPQTLLDRKIIALFMMYFIGSFLTPPVLLIVAVTAENFAELFSAEHWKGLFSGRTNDLFAVYAVYAGGVTVAALACLPSVVIAFLMNTDFGLFVGGLALCFLLGVSMDLLGRLCGFFALGDFESIEQATSEPQPVPAGPPRRDVPIPVTPLPIVPIADLAPLPVPEPVTPPLSQAKKPPLIDAKKRVDAILSRQTDDPAAALVALESLDESYAPNAHVAGALCICHQRGGNTERAFELAENAFDLSLRAGHTHLAADVFRELRPQADRLKLNLDQVLSIAGAAGTKGDLATAAQAYSMILQKDAGEMRAIKGLLQVAERIRREKNNAAAALKVYLFLQQHCAASPLIEFITLGVTETERQLAGTP